MTTHLMNRSSFTLLQSTIRISSLVKKASENGDRYVALTDHNVMYGVPSFLHACKQYNVHPIIGLEVDCMYHDEIVPFLLLAKDNAGFINLQKLSSIVCGENAYCDVDTLHTFSQHCFLIVYGEGGYFEGDLLKDKFDIVREKLITMQQELPLFDIALSYQESPLHHEKNKRLKGIAQSLKIRTVALNKNYCLAEDELTQLQVLQAIDRKTNIHDTSLVLHTGRYYLSHTQMAALYDEDDLMRTDEIARMCKANGELPLATLPPFDTAENFDEVKYLKKLCQVGLEKRLGGNIVPAYQQRLNHELDIIVKMNFTNYFLIVYDFVRYARKNNIYVGPGRGSAAGSLVAYCLGITMIDPMKYNLLFERFLNPDRITMPDIDVDIPDDRRDEVIAYVREKYGYEHVANMVTFGTLKARQCLRDVAKVMQLMPSTLDQLLKMLPNKSDIKLQQILEDNTRLKQFVDSNIEITKVYEMAMHLEELPRHMSVHPAGIVLSSQKINDIVPTIQTDQDLLTSQYTSSYMEERGLIKMDFLSLRNLTTIQEIEQQIQKTNPSFRILNIPLDDVKTYQIFSHGLTLGVFQFESHGIQNLIRQMKPKSYQDITASLALYRPSAMKHIQEYLTLRDNPNQVKYVKEQLRPILQETYGIMIYQEQTMQVAQIAAGFSLAKADLLRQAISEKRLENLQKLKAEFINGCIQNQYSLEEAQHLYDQIEEFAGYGFNKSHAVAYALISYQTAYLKANYPYPFYVSLLNSYIGDTSKTSLYIDECKRRKINVLAPSINEAKSSYYYTKKGLQLPLSIVRGIGANVARKIEEERDENGMYKDFFSFVARMCLIDVSEAMMTSMIQAGCLDEFKVNRTTMLEGLADAVRYGKLIQVHQNNQLTLDFNLVSMPRLIAYKDDKIQNAEKEFEVLGFYLVQSPLQELRNVHQITLPSIISIKSTQGYISSFARVERIREHRTKKGDMMMFVNVRDDTDEITLLIFPKVYEQYHAILTKGVYIVFHGKMSQDQSVICNQIQMIQ